jgi:hypothetical protein
MPVFIAYSKAEGKSRASSLQPPASSRKQTLPTRTEADERMLNLFPPVPNNDDRITKQEPAKRLHETPRCIELWMRRRYRLCLKVGRSVLFNWPDIVRALERFRTGDRSG